MSSAIAIQIVKVRRGTGELKPGELVILTPVHPLEPYRNAGSLFQWRELSVTVAEDAS